MHKPSDGADGARFADLDPEAALDRDFRVMLEPPFLAALHRELCEACDPDTVARWLLRVGFLHGMQDAYRAQTASLRRAAFSPPLAIRYRAVPAGGAIEVHGDWPECREASARLGAGRPGGGGEAGRCALTAGYTSGWLSGMLDADLIAVEQSCGVHGRGACRFVAREASRWADFPDAPGDVIPFEAFRALVRGREARDAMLHARLPVEEGAIDPDAACVHIWGPVMVIPFGGPDEGLRALELMGRDPEAAEVSVVVVHLGHALIDEAFGALALEQIVQTAEAWGAETLFAEPSPLSEHVLGGLEHPPLLVLKDLEQAVVAAFQIADSQRRLS